METIGQNNINIKVKKLIKELLADIDIDEFDENKTFQEMGLNSINLIKLILMVEKEFNIEFDKISLSAINRYKSMCCEIDKIVNK